MSKFSWRNGFAVGLTVGGCLTVVGLLFFVSGQSEVTQLAYAVDQTANNTHQFGDGNKPVWGPWFGLCFGLFDSLAQWIMMAFTVVAAGLLYGTLLQANKTNQAAVNASKAALEANQIMRNEQRPIFAFNELRIQEVAREGSYARFDVRASFTNVGKAPGRIIGATLSVVRKSIPDGVETVIRRWDKADGPNLIAVDRQYFGPYCHIESSDFKGGDVFYEMSFQSANIFEDRVEKRVGLTVSGRIAPIVRGTDGRNTTIQRGHAGNNTVVGMMLQIGPDSIKYTKSSA